MTHPDVRTAGCNRPFAGDNINAAILAEIDDERKAYATLQARAALFGYELHRLERGTLLLRRGFWCREFADEAAADLFLDVVRPA